MTKTYLVRTPVRLFKIRALSLTHAARKAAKMSPIVNGVFQCR